MKGWNLQMYHGQRSQRLLSKKSKLVVLFFWTRLAHPDHQLPLHSGQVVLNVVEVVVVVVVLVFFRIWFGHGHGRRSIPSPINQIVMNVQSYASSELLFRKLSQTSKKPVGASWVFCELETGHIPNSKNNEKFVMHIWRKWQIHKPCLTPCAPRWTLQTPPCTTLSPCCGLQQSPILSLCQLVTDFNQSTLCHLV